MKYIVTGGAGFIGSNLVDALINEGHEVIVIDNLSTGKQENINNKAELVICDISHQDHLQKMEEVASGVDTIFHLAALARVQPSIENPNEFNKVNVNGTLNVLNIAKNSVLVGLFTAPVPQHTEMPQYSQHQKITQLTH